VIRVERDADQRHGSFCRCRIGDLGVRRIRLQPDRRSRAIIATGLSISYAAVGKQYLTLPATTGGPGASVFALPAL